MAGSAEMANRLVRSSLRTGPQPAPGELPLVNNPGRPLLAGDRNVNPDGLACGTGFP